MVVDGIPNVRTCLTLVRPGCRVEIQEGVGPGFVTEVENA
jgi:hypothetical protein